MLLQKQYFQKKYKISWLAKISSLNKMQKVTIIREKIYDYHCTKISDYYKPKNKRMLSNNNNKTQTTKHWKNIFTVNN